MYKGHQLFQANPLFSIKSQRYSMVFFIETLIKREVMSTKTILCPFKLNPLM